MRSINRLRKNNQRTVDFFRSLPELYAMFKQQTKLSVIRIATLIFLTKFINMVVMFMPFKILLLLTGFGNISFLQNIENSIGREVYIGIMIVIIASLFFLNLVFHIHQARLVKMQKLAIEKKKYEFRGMQKSYKVISSTFEPFCRVIGDIFLVLLVATILLLVNVVYALFYISMVLIYIVISEQWVFANHQTRLLKKLKIDSKLFIRITGILFFLIFFLGIIALVLKTDMLILLTILMLLLVRLGNGALQSFFSSQIKLRQHYL